VSVVPYVIEQTGRGESVYDIYSRLLKDRIVFLGTEINAQVANSVIAQLLLLDAQNPEREIQIFINSPGGEVYAGLAIYDVMQFVRAPIRTVCVGMAMSAGSVILMAGATGRRSALPNARVMIHQGSAGFRGNTADVEVQARELFFMRDRLLELYLKHTGITREKLARDWQRDHFLTAVEAKEYGLIDEVIEVTAKELSAVMPTEQLKSLPPV
jgi:ATP-dependent Clp protease, protease subunit